MGQRGLRVEGVLPREANHGGAPLDPVVRRPLVLGVQDGRLQLAVTLLDQIPIRLQLRLVLARTFLLHLIEEIRLHRRGAGSVAEWGGAAAAGVVGARLEGADDAVHRGLEARELAVID